MPVTSNSSIDRYSRENPAMNGGHARTGSVPIRSESFFQSKAYGTPTGLSSTIPQSRGTSAAFRPMHMRTSSSAASGMIGADRRPAAGLPSSGSSFSLDRRYGRGLSSLASSSAGSYSTADGSYFSQKITGVPEPSEPSPLMKQALPTPKSSDKAPVVADDDDDASLSKGTIVIWDIDMMGTDAIVAAKCSNDCSPSSSPFVPEGGLVGLRNLGNTCYMNAVLQCLLHTTELYDSFVAAGSDGYGNGAVCAAFGDLIRDVYGSSKDVQEPKAFKRVMGRRNKQWAGYNQQDAQELLSDILDALNTEMGGASGVDKSDSRAASKSSLLRLLKKDKSSAISNAFRGVYLSTVHCSACDYESRTKELFYVLPLPLSRSVGMAPTLGECLEQFKREELLKGDEQWTCDKCKRKVDAQKRMDLEELPTVLVMCLMRFTWSMSGMARKITFRVDAPIEGFVVGQDVYDLYATIEHSGSSSIDFGHYTAHVCGGDGRWWRYDDSHVSELPSSAPSSIARSFTGEAGIPAATVFGGRSVSPLRTSTVRATSDTTASRASGSVGNPAPPVVRRVIRTVVKSSPSPSSGAPNNVYTPKAATAVLHTMASSGTYRSQSPTRGTNWPQMPGAASTAFTVMGSSISNFPPVSPVLPGRDCLGYIASTGVQTRPVGLGSSASSVNLASRPSPTSKSYYDSKTLYSGLPAYSLPRPTEAPAAGLSGGGLNTSASVRVMSSVGQVVPGVGAGCCSPPPPPLPVKDDSRGNGSSSSPTRIEGVSDYSSNGTRCEGVSSGDPIKEEEEGVDGEPLEDEEDDDEVVMDGDVTDDGDKDDEGSGGSLVISPVKDAPKNSSNMEVPISIALKWLLSSGKDEVERWTTDLTDVGLRNVLEVVASHVRQKGRHLEDVEREIKEAKGLSAFAFFGLDENCDIAELKKAYKEKSRELHPDKGGDEEAFVDMKSKYEDILQQAENSGSDSTKTQEKGSIGWDPKKRDTMITALFELKHQVMLIEQKIGNLQEELEEVRNRKKMESRRTKEMLPPVAEGLGEEFAAS
ncbi:hypothetical protein FOL47_000131 [Perkinsus chesapeaki]|uniref:Uncharacterized protein n=1 Tax=Perkinsus chesapeaki TaxID=330153 RepID=A0A7J6N187_PERCH|nr:hypothetical protein FOL47_000131 [Perkinsus chesapeaki]